MLAKLYKDAGHKSHFTLFVIEINDAKGLKQSFGEVYYADAIKVLIDRLSDILPLGTRISQYTYDSFAIVVEREITATELEDVCIHMVYECNKTINMVANLLIEFEINIGVAEYNSFSRSAAQIMQNANTALVAAKKRGVINQWAIYNAGLDNTESEEYKFYQEIKQAIEHNEFILYYQPIIVTATKQTYGYESLLRWNHKTLGVLPPQKFLSIIEMSGDINWVGVWAFEQMLLQYCTWKSHDPERKLIVTINLSAKQLMNEKIVDDFKQIIKKYRINPKEICLEIMEFALFDKMNVIRENIRKFSQMGLLIAIDNFGLELNTLKVLEQMDIDIIKLDKDFIGKVQENNSFNTNIVEMLKSYADRNKIKLVAGGVENEMIFEMIKKMGIELCQGYYLGMPKSGKELN